MKKLESTELYRSLRERILRGELAAGRRLIIRELAMSHGISDMPVREALWMLARDGLVEMTPHAGARVAEMTRDEILEVLDVRAELEGMATRLATPCLTQQDFDNLRRILDDSHALLESAEPDPLSYAALNSAFHNAIFDCCPNRRLVGVIVHLWEGHSQLQTVFRINPSRLRASLSEHEAIYAALEVGNQQLASDLAKKHKNLQRDDLLLALTDGSDEQAAGHQS